MQLPARSTARALITATVALLPLGAGASLAAATPVTAPAGTLCRFTVHSGVPFDQEYVRSTETYTNGKPKTQEFVGPLVVRVVNRTSGRSVVRDLSGRAIADYGRDGSFDFRIQGPAADGTRTVLVDRGTEENLCATLS